MSQSDGKKTPPSGGPDPGKSYAVGYGRPPQEYRFKPGQSGNPSGRRRQSSDPNSLEKLKELILKEAYRPIRVREGDKTIRLPAIQASLRTHLMSAAKGDTKAFNTAISLVSAIESKNAELRLQHFAAALEYKLGMEVEIARRKREGIVAPDPLPHPDDIILNPRTGEVSIKGPLDEREKALFEEVKCRHAELTEQLRDLQEMLASTRSRARKEMIMSLIDRITWELGRLAEFLET
ncbi:DUF5681 domain-containing protein [Aestuariivirga sp.]|uniref:DUF5681 domain-containing protein n=1 Tax=Aestuariivirga sp. TaxID=2650926 RepID=UPI00391B1823